ncbi:unnamed protein product [Toxocara canis]|uniref:Protein SZT2 n=1 Tax=Toxocara canis TaxID=6265 RepID=A0A183VA05_TOXCA|nr:unnamed protein product [Toxocara canis]
MPTLNGLSDEGSETVREAREVVLFMHRNCRVSRNIRALWFFDHLNKCVAIEEAPANDDYGREIEIVGMVAKSGGEAQVGEQFKICSDTVVTYLSKLYRLVFVLDLSPSAVVADETSGCVLHVKLMECLRRCLVGVTRSFNFPGTKRQFSAQLYVSVCVYSPFICFDGDPVLLQGALLNADNVERTVEFIGAKLAFFTNKLCDCMRPHLRRWNRERRRVRKEADELIPGTFFRQQSTYPDDEQLEANCSLSASNECRRTSTTVNASDEGFIQPEWSLIFMLRMGLLGVQMLPENTRSSIIVITDAVCGMPDVNALQQLLTQLRSFTVSCSFIQLQKKNTEEPVFGLVSYPELFHFLAMATFGTYIPDCQCSFRDMRQSEMNAFHRALLCWSFQRALADNEHIRSLVNEINPDFADFYISDIVRRKHLSLEYETNLPNLLYVRMREGYTIKEIRFAEKGKEKNETFIVVELRLPWKPLVFIEYKITAPWPASNRREKVKVSLVFEAPYNVMKDLVSERRFASPQRQSAVDAFKNAIGNLLKADRLLIHIHSFNSHPDYFSLPSEVSKESALFRFLPNGSKSASAVTLLSRYF